jgi:hypothetical protein
MHLAPEELIDVAEGTRAEAAVPHLQSCEACRQQVVTLRKMMSAVGSPESHGVNVPEPSPLFWDHLSQRVHEAVAAEGTPGSRFAGWRWETALSASWRTWAMAGVAAAVLISIYVTAPHTLAPPSGGLDGAAATSTALQPFGAADDPSLMLFADLTEQLDSQAITETGWSSHVGAVDEVVASLTGDERVELQRLLKEELAKS